MGTGGRLQNDKTMTRGLQEGHKNEVKRGTANLQDSSALLLYMRRASIQDMQQQVCLTHLFQCRLHSTRGSLSKSAMTLTKQLLLKEAPARRHNVAFQQDCLPVAASM